ncbi:hypothetical protein GNI_106250 [Gregarina niphandrodes]|uniref:Uncharacterized protein n=1 Tax=Gregarina niphandrodes TaxID=110365 RepID=A0A023B471_GRENI|nr:hypothetical protein GNI_106250 [Gregarina niphandrodes]EZG56030.1 hypothetical protein GNI_106250 [Gregarina niphandrodes]|eukprot:XP_011131371.1 hypothetical protein GNI_106250 [Gregarina niphandrodes]
MSGTEELPRPGYKKDDDEAEYRCGEARFGFHKPKEDAKQAGSHKLVARSKILIGDERSGQGVESLVGYSGRANVYLVCVVDAGKIPLNENRTADDFVDLGNLLQWTKTKSKTGQRLRRKGSQRAYPQELLVGE